MKLKDIFEADEETVDQPQIDDTDDTDETTDETPDDGETDVGVIAERDGWTKSKKEMFAFGATRPVTLLTKNEKLGGLQLTLQYIINPKTGAWSLRACLAGQSEADMVEFETGEDPTSLAVNLKKKKKITPHQAVEYLNPPVDQDAGEEEVT